MIDVKKLDIPDLLYKAYEYEKWKHELKNI